MIPLPLKLNGWSLISQSEFKNKMGDKKLQSHIMKLLYLHTLWLLEKRFQNAFVNTYI